MIIVTDYKLTRNRDSEILVEYGNIPQCPICHNSVKYRDLKKRYIKYPGGGRKTFVLQRCKCTKCGSLHTCLPDCAVPYKHYSSGVIEDVLDGTTTADDIETEDYPTEGTMRLWKEWLLYNLANIKGYLHSLSLQARGEDLSISIDNIIDSQHKNWLRKIIVFIYNSGGALNPLGS